MSCPCFQNIIKILYKCNFIIFVSSKIKFLVMKKLFAILICMFLSLSVVAQSQYLKDEKGTQKLSLEITQLFSQNKIQESFDQLIPYWPNALSELDLMKEQTIVQLKPIKDRIGEPYGVLKIKNETISDVLTRETYLILYEKSPLRLIFDYYKTDKGWIIYRFLWDGSIDDEFE